MSKEMGLLLNALFLALFLVLTKAEEDADLLQSLLSTTNHTTHHSNSNIRKLRGGGGRGRCNWFRGKWVYDASYPLYNYATCPFIDPEFNCLKYGRPDTAYLKYRWQPFACNLPRFNGLRFLEEWRGKRIMFVGDSLSSNMWQSLSCMIHAWVPNSRTSVVRTEGLSQITFLDYGVSLLLYRTTFLVDLVNENGVRILKLDSINGGKTWRQMDMVIFNTWHWWTHSGRTQTWDYIEEGGKRYKDMNRLVAYYKGLTTWARWVNLYVDPAKTKIVFQDVSPTHYEGQDWGEQPKTCAGQTQPFMESKYPVGPPSAWVVVNMVMSRIKKPVHLLDITILSQFRKDAHPTYYSGEHSGLDCSHWCLPGLPDTWNQLLYATLFN